MQTPFRLFLIVKNLVTGWAILTASFPAASHGGDQMSSDFGQAGLAHEIQRRVVIDMSDNMRFSPSSLQVKQGETIGFVIRNRGRVKHEFVLGNAKALTAHNEFMKLHPEMEHEEDNMVTVLPGATAELVWQFSHRGTIHFACLQPGHYDAGMKGRIAVSQSSRKSAVIQTHRTH